MITALPLHEYRNMTSTSIHIIQVGPRYNERYQTAAESALHYCYRNALELLVENKLRWVWVWSCKRFCVCLMCFVYICRMCCTHQCLLACVSLCKYVYMYVCVLVCTYVCIYMYVCMYIYIYIYIHAYTYAHTHMNKQRRLGCANVCVHMYVYICVCADQCHLGSILDCLQDK
jgi:hypothetical protein